MFSTEVGYYRTTWNNFQPQVQKIRNSYSEKIFLYISHQKSFLHFGE